MLGFGALPAHVSVFSSMSKINKKVFRGSIGGNLKDPYTLDCPAKFFCGQVMWNVDFMSGLGEREHQRWCGTGIRARNCISFSHCSLCTQVPLHTCLVLYVRKWDLVVICKQVYLKIPSLNIISKTIFWFHYNSRYCCIWINTNEIVELIKTWLNKVNQYY